MKKTLAVFAFAALSAMAAEYKGTIMDANCASKPEMRTNEACAARCIKGGAAAVLVTDEGKIYKIANQDKVTPHAGHKVTVTGKLDGDTITADDVKM